MHPIEHLRYVARYGDDEGDAVAIAEEAALALGSLGYEPRAIVPSCRRLLEAHRACGPLWWVAARILVADNVSHEVRRILDGLSGDETYEELASAFVSNADVAAEASRSIVGALGMRPDLEIRLLGEPRALRSGLRALGLDANASGWDLDEADEAAFDADLVVVDALMAGPQGFLLSETGSRLIEAAERQSKPCWVCVGVGRLLPTALFARALVLNGVASESDEHDDIESERDVELDEEERDGFARRARFAPVSLATRVVGSKGVELPRRALARPTCTAPSELLFSASIH